MPMMWKNATQEMREEKCARMQKYMGRRGTKRRAEEVAATKEAKKKVISVAETEAVSALLCFSSERRAGNNVDKINEDD
jgi:hypothetical protein